MIEQPLESGDNPSADLSPDDNRTVPEGEAHSASEDDPVDCGAPEAETTETSEPETAETPDSEAIEIPELEAIETPESGTVETPESGTVETPESGTAETPVPKDSPEPRPSLPRRVLSRVGDILFYISIPILIVLVVLMVSSRINGGTPSLFGVSLVTVETGSMHPGIPQGSLVAYRESQVEDIQVGDVITYSLTGNSNVTHRVVEVLHADDETSYVTKGDANDANDPNEVPYDSVHGVVVFSLPLLGYLFGLLRPPGYGFLIVVIPAVAIIALEVKKLIVLAKTPTSETDQEEKKES